MQVTPLSVAGAFLFEPRVFADPRGHFVEIFSRRLRRDRGSPPSSRRQMLRCRAPARSAADISPSCRPARRSMLLPSAARFDVVVDLRVGSPTYTKWDGAHLTPRPTRPSTSRRAAGTPSWRCKTICGDLPVFSAHAPHRENGLHPLDETVGVTWPGEHAGNRSSPCSRRRMKAHPT